MMVSSEPQLQHSYRKSSAEKSRDSDLLDGDSLMEMASLEDATNTHVHAGSLNNSFSTGDLNMSHRRVHFHHDPSISTNISKQSSVPRLTTEKVVSIHNLDDKNSNNNNNNADRQFKNGSSQHRPQQYRIPLQQSQQQLKQSKAYLWKVIDFIDRWGFIREILQPDSVQLIVLCLLWYGSSAMTNNIAKQIFQLVKCPVTLTYVQFGFNAVFCFIFGYFSNVVDRAVNVAAGKSPLIGSASDTFSDHGKASSQWWQIFTSGLSFRKFMPSIRLIPFPFLRRIFRILFLIIGWVLSRLVDIIHYFGKLLRFWIALGLGIHEDEYMAAGGGVSNTAQHYGDRLHKTHVLKPSMSIVRTMAPLSVFLISGHVFSSIALSNVPVSFVHTIKALSPLFTVLIFRFVWKTRYQTSIYVSLVPLTLGVMLACSSEISFNMVGLLCALASTLIFVCQNIFSKKLFKERTLDKLNMLLYSNSLSFIFMCPIWFWSEGHGWFVKSDVVPDLHAAQSGTDWSMYTVSSLFILNGLSHFMQNVFAFSILSLVSPVTYSIASLIKRIVVIVASILWFGQHVENVQICGIVLTFVGLWMYQHVKHNMHASPSASSVNNSQSRHAGINVEPRNEDEALESSRAFQQQQQQQTQPYMNGQQSPSNLQLHGVKSLIDGSHKAYHKNSDAEMIVMYKD
ncbi:hypothetical protein MP228_004473 [Amoeboaphelidium protococcarum]|nr:hypothetical protein MP228_004473 [Amoeboaphelidium protococcarum]